MEHYKGSQVLNIFICFFIWFRVNVWMKFTQLWETLWWFQYCCTHRELLTICECLMIFTLPSLYSSSTSGELFTQAIVLFVLHGKTHVPTHLSYMHSTMLIQWSQFSKHIFQLRETVMKTRMEIQETSWEIIEGGTWKMMETYTKVRIVNVNGY